MESHNENVTPVFTQFPRQPQRFWTPDLSRNPAGLLQRLRAGGAPIITGSTVHFVYYGPGARDVAITGELNDWGRTGIALAMSPLGRTGFFHRSVELERPARIEYKLVVDGQVISDPLNPSAVDSGIGGWNSCFVVGDFPDPPELERMPGVPHGRVEQLAVESRLLDNRRSVYVYLPPGYDGEPPRRFPALYVHDGGQYLNRARLPNVLDNLIAGRRIAPLIAVMVDPVNRSSEYRASQTYAAFVESELVPYIDRRFRTIADREARAVMGASLGGLISIYLALSRPHLFSKCGGQSSALRLDEALIASLATRAGGGVRFYLDIGKYELRALPAHRRIGSLLHARGWPLLYREVGAGHNWFSWRAQLSNLLTFLWPPQAP